jgi:hypothetical protein
MDDPLNYERVKIDRGHSAKDIKDARMHIGIKNNLRNMTQKEVRMVGDYLKLDPEYVPYGTPELIKK